MKLHHIGYVVRDINESVNKYRQIFHIEKESNIIYDPNQEVRVKFIWNDPGEYSSMEFIEPVSESSPVYGALDKYGGGLHHLCYEVLELDAEISLLLGRGALLVKPPKPAAAFNNRKVAFMYTIERLIIELLEEGE